MSLYADNLIFIEKHNPAVYRAIAAGSATEDVIEHWPETDNFLLSRDGMKVLLHSEFDRERETDRLLQPVGDNDKTIVLFGLGNGMLLPAIHRRFPKLEHLVVVEPNAQMMQFFLQKNDFVKTFCVFRKVSFIIGKTVKEAKENLEILVGTMDYVEKKISLVAPIAYRTLYADYYSAMLQATVGAIRFHRVNMATAEAFRLTWLVNDWRNLKHVSPDVGVLKDTFAGRPAIVVSAGPSLQKNVHLLREVRDRALIIAVGSAITILQSHGITPHFRIAVDGAVENRLLFEKVDTSACPLLYLDHLFYEVIENYKGPKVQMLSANSANALIPYIFIKAGLSFMPVQSGFSVANTALFLLLQLRCSPIVIMGQDLCYSRGKMHAEGSWDEDNDEKYIKKEIETVDILGNTVYTDSAFIGMKKIFEGIIADHPTVRFLNATEGGLGLDGAENVKLADLLQTELAASYPIAEDIERILRDQEANLADKADKINGVVGEIAADVETVLDYCRRVDEKYHQIYQMVQAGRKKDVVLKETRKLRQLIGRLDSIHFYKHVILPAFQESFNVRRGAVDYANDDWRQQWIKEIGLLRLEIDDVWTYVSHTQALIHDYQGKQPLNIIFE